MEPFDETFGAIRDWTLMGWSWAWLRAWISGIGASYAYIWRVVMQDQVSSQYPVIQAHSISIKPVATSKISPGNQAQWVSFTGSVKPTEEPIQAST